MAGTSVSPVATLSQVKSYLGITGDDQDAKLQIILDAQIEQVKGMFESFGLKLEKETLVEIREGGDLGPKIFSPFHHVFGADAVHHHHGFSVFAPGVQPFDHIFTKFRPIISVTSVHDSNDDPPIFDSTTLLDADDFRFISNEGIIRRIDGNIFFIGVQNVRLEYEAGFEPIPNDINLAVLQGIDQFVSKAGRGALQSERLGEYSYVLKDISKQAEDMKFLLNRYLRPGTLIVGA